MTAAAAEVERLVEAAAEVERLVEAPPLPVLVGFAAVQTLTMIGVSITSLRADGWAQPSQAAEPLATVIVSDSLP